MKKSRLIRAIELGILALEIKPNYVVRTRLTSGMVINELKIALTNIKKETYEDRQNKD